MKILYIPLDERPCNAKYPTELLKGQKKVELVVPPLEILNKKKVPAHIEEVWDFIHKEIESCDAAILSVEMLIYGGLLPSRLHQIEESELLERCERLRRLKETYPHVAIYTFNVIMRVPAYDSSEEEPDYYETHGRRIFELSWLTHKMKQDVATEEDKANYDALLQDIPQAYREDYFGRRKKNFKVTSKLLDLVKEGVVESMVIPQDDTALYGVQAIEQGDHIGKIKALELQNKVFIYPGADEVGCTLVSRVINQLEGCMPKVFVRFSSSQGPFIIPSYEDRPYMETIKWHIISSGMCIADSSADADMIFMVNTPGKETKEAPHQDQGFRENSSMRNLMEFVTAIKMYLNDGKKVVVADVAYSNGADKELITLLRLEKVMSKLSGYGGWNTNGNTLGTALCSGVVAIHYGVSKDFLVYRLVEDCGYQAIVRQHIIGRLPEKDLSYYDFKDQERWVEEITKESLQTFVEEMIASAFEEEIRVVEVGFPWHRMFEVDLEIELKKRG